MNYPWPKNLRGQKRRGLSYRLYRHLLGLNVFDAVDFALIVIAKILAVILIALVLFGAYLRLD
jgi:hypothetical protein